MSILHRLDSIISVELFATLAGLSLVALSITAIAWELRERISHKDGSNPQRSLSDKERRFEVLEQYFGMGYFVSSVTIFVLGLVLTLIFDSLGGKYHDNLSFELSNVIPTSLLVLLGLLLLFGGINTIVRLTMKRNFLFSLDRLDICRDMLMSMLNFVLPPEQDKHTDKGEGAASRVPISSETELAIVRLGDLLKTFFIVGLLSLWVGEQNSGRSISPTRLEWWPYVLVSIFVFVAYLLIAAKKVHSPIWRWLLGILFLGLVWFPYVISWYPPPASFLTVLAGILLVLAFILFLVLLLALVLKKRGVWKKVDRPFRHFVTWGNNVSWPLSLVALLASVLLGWARLKESNVHGWWMDPLLYMGILISFVVSLEAVRGRRTYQDQ